MPVYLLHALNFQHARPNVKAGVIPGGTALLALKHAIEAGRVPGMTKFFPNLFADGIHLTGAGRYFIGLVHYACLYGRSPVGLPVVGTNGFATTLTPAQASIFQQIAWDTVTQFGKNPGMVAPAIPGEIDARAYVNSVPPYHSSGDVRYINKDTTYDYLVNAPKAGLYTLTISAGNGSGSAKPLDILLNGAPLQTISIPATANETTYVDSPPVTLTLKPGANWVTLHIPVDRPYNLNSVKFTGASIPALTDTLPTTDFFSFEPTTKPGVPYTVDFTVRDAHTPSEKIGGTAVSDNPTLLPPTQIAVTAGDFSDQYGNHLNRRLTVTPAPGQTGKALVTLSLKNAAGRTRRISVTLTVK